MLVGSCLRQPSSLLRSTSSRLLTKHASAPPHPSLRTLHRRQAHSLPSLGTHNDHILAQGIEGLYSAEAVEQAWTKYQTMMLNRLSDSVAGNKHEFSDPKQILLDTARNPDTPNTFNYASMAHNNHFYWSSLSPSQTTLPAELDEAITRSFSSVHTFRSAFLQTAASMFGPGFVWLVMHHEPPQGRHNLDPRPSIKYDLRILPTYLAGSPYPGAHARQQSRDMNTTNLEAERLGGTAPPMPHSNTQYGGANVTPILCVSTWEHSYLLDWGADGRRLFLQAWWDRINWDQVGGRASAASSTHGRRAFNEAAVR